jgi:hypothetical protein
MLPKEPKTVEEEKTILDELSDALPSDGINPMEIEEEDKTPPAPSAEKKEVKATPPSEGESDEDNLPFHKHPRFKNLIKENKELKTMLAEINQKLSPKENTETPSTDTIPNWFKSIYGDNQELYKEFSTYSNQQQQEIVAKAVETLREEMTKPQREAEQVQQWISEKLTELHDEGEEFTDDELINVMKEYTPFGENGQLDFRKGLKLMKAFATVKSKDTTDKEKSEARKKIGAMTAGGGQGTPPKSAVNMNDIRKKSWNQLVRED